jgi:hypothetical protein
MYCKMKQPTPLYTAHDKTTILFCGLLKVLKHELVGLDSSRGLETASLSLAGYPWLDPVCI